MTIHIILLALLVLFALLAVLAFDLIISAICLALTSVILAIIIFQLNAPLAAIFELSVCAGLITVIFISTISLTKIAAPGEAQAKPAQRLIERRWFRYMWLPIILLIVGSGLFLVMHIQPPQAGPVPATDIKTLLWNARPMDLLGMALMILVGVFGIVVLFKEKSKDE